MSDLEAKRKLARYTKRVLQRNFRCRYPVRVVFVEPAILREAHDGPAFGDCLIDHESAAIRIRLSTALSDEWLRETMWHEWAHAYALSDKHDAAWALAYGQIYSRWHEG